MLLPRLCGICLRGNRGEAARELRQISGNGRQIRPAISPATGLVSQAPDVLLKRDSSDLHLVEGRHLLQARALRFECFDLLLELLKIPPRNLQAGTVEEVLAGLACDVDRAVQCVNPSGKQGCFFASRE
jgi:hypothetical protein